MKKTAIVLICCSILTYGFSNKDYSNLELAQAVHKVESSGRIDKNIIGDNGKAIGPLQIHYLNWRDATDFDKTIGGQYLDCHSLKYSKTIFCAYLNKYAKNKSTEQKARIWNGGPKGAEKSSTKHYWNKIKKNL